MVCLVTFECVATPGNGDTVFKKLKELLPNTRNKEGFIDLVAHIDQDDRDRLLCVQHWENREAQVRGRGKGYGDGLPLENLECNHHQSQKPALVRIA